jgi:beta-glucosidase
MEILRGLGHVRAGWTIANQAFQAAPGCEAERDAYAYPREDFFLEVSREDDFVGVQAYLRTIIGADGPIEAPADAERTLTGWEYYPAALGEALRYSHALTGGVPMIVTENGIATADDSRRIDYTRGALAGMAAAIDAGCQVEGYLHWSLLDNFEWMSGFAPTFGLIGVNRDTFERTPKPSLAWLGKVAQSGNLV